MSAVPQTPVPTRPTHAPDQAARAWRAACAATGRRAQGTPAVTPLKTQRPGRKSVVYRLAGAGDDGSDVVAKHCTRSTGAVERLVYERILPRLDISTGHYYGYWDDHDGEFCWLILEDAGERKLAVTDRELAAEWLARLHTGAQALTALAPLPDRGPSHYLSHLRAGRALVRALLDDLQMPDDVTAAAHAILRLADRLESRWQSVCSSCDAAPRTLVHGDFCRKNLRLRTNAGGPQLIALDWETAGWGPPAADIPFSPTRCLRPHQWDGTVPLDAYARHAAERWDGPRMRDLERLARIGILFRAIAGVRWAAEKIQGGGMAKGGEQLCWAANLLTGVLAELDLA